MNDRVSGHLPQQALVFLCSLGMRDTQGLNVGTAVEDNMLTIIQGKGSKGGSHWLHGRWELGPKGSQIASFSLVRKETGLLELTAPSSHRADMQLRA
jgi:hypothetical protein